jgi:hypothetical protein
MEWQKTYGANGSGSASSVESTRDGGYIVASTIRLEENDKPDIRILKLDAEGSLEWEKTFGGDEMDIARSIYSTSDGGYIVAGTTQSKGAGRTDGWIIKMDSQGNLEWDKTYGGNDIDFLPSIVQTDDGGYTAAGFTDSKGAGETDAWIIKLDSLGNIEWDRTYGGSEKDGFSSVSQTHDGGYVAAGHTYSKGAGKSDAWILKLDSKGNLNCQ